MTIHANIKVEVGMGLLGENYLCMESAQYLNMI
jgi:hypothetical protein